MADTRNVKLPDGADFLFWEPVPRFAHTYYVSANDPAASDDNPGTKDRPFRTIQRAAEVLQPGERVLIGEGVYREWVCPPRGGDAPDRMIAYHAAPGAKVVIKGSEMIEPSLWIKSRQLVDFVTNFRFLKIPLEPFLKMQPNLNAPIWCVRMPRKFFDGYNPFNAINRAQLAAEAHRRIDPASGARFELGNLVTTLLKRGLVFQNGRRLKQVAHQAYMSLQDGTYWVESDGLTLHVRPYGDIDPREATFEVTARERLFAPEAYNLGYLWLQGLTLEQAANGWPLPPVGAVATIGGHHWVIEDCSVSQINAVGIDLGYHSEHLEYEQGKTFGFHIVRRNAVSDCGVSGIAGNGLPYSLVERNTVTRCAWHEIEKNYEQAGIKFHHTLNTLVRRNVVHDIRQGSGIWLDAGIENTRCCENLIYDIETGFGGIFVEVSKTMPDLVDHNLIFNIRGNGIYEHDVERLQVAHNLVAHCTGAALMLKRGQADRLTLNPRRGSTGRKQRVFNNLLVDCGTMIQFHNDDQQSDHNAFTLSRDLAPFRLHAYEEYLDLAAWQEFHGLDEHSVELPIDVEFAPETFQVRVRVEGELPRGNILPGMEQDVLGQARTGETTIPGPFAALPADSVAIDPRIKE